jgi:hypothetical protein
MKITRTSILTGNEHTREIDVTQEQLDAWEEGQNIQYAMPNLSPSEREFIKTGITTDEWNAAFPQTDEDD